MIINKSDGLNKSEEYISKLCENSFLKLWVYPNLYKNKGQELCDVLIVFNNNVFVFSIKDIQFDENKDINLAWKRWKKTAIEKSIKQVNGAARWIMQHPDRIFLDPNCTQKFPIKIDTANLKIFKIIVAFGIENACKKYYEPDSTGSLPVIYCKDTNIEIPATHLFCLKMDKDNIVHILDDYSSSVMFNELDTIADIKRYFEAKEEAINEFDNIMILGEEDVIATYLINMYMNIYENPVLPFNESMQKDFMMYESDFYKKYQNSDMYRRQNELNKHSYLIDNILQKTMDNALNNKLAGNEDVFNGEGAIKELTKLSRFMRRNLGLKFIDAIEKFPLREDPLFRQVSSVYDKNSRIAYIFLQVNYNYLEQKDKNISRKIKIAMLEVAAASYFEKVKEVQKVVGIGVNAPLYHNDLMEDFVLVERNMLTKDFLEYVEKANNVFHFWDSSHSYKQEVTIHAYQDIVELLK